jgi:mRNA-degrading endonuclease RelE of RelBE toxin-antitoxin system
MTVNVQLPPQFYRVADRLKKKYPHILDDLLPLLEQLSAGETPGDRLQEITPYIVYKVRVKNSDARKGRRGGYRVVYYLKTKDHVLLVTIYTKTDTDVLPIETIRSIIDEIEP